MKSPGFIIAHPAVNMDRIERILDAGRAKKWLYMGSDYFVRTAIEKRLDGIADQVDMVKVHRDAADDIKGEYVEWVDGINRKSGKALDWWFGSVFSRNNYTSDLFQYACYLEVLERLSLNESGVPDIIFVESFGFAKAVKKWASEKNIYVKVLGGSFSGSRWRCHVMPLICWGKSVISLFSILIAAKSSGFGKSKQLKLFKDNTIILHTFVNDKCISEDGEFSDPHFPYLYKYVEEKGFSIIVHPVLCCSRNDYFSVYRKMRKSPTHFIIKEDFLCPIDYMAALLYPVRSILRKVGTQEFRGFDMSGIIKDEKAREQFFPGMLSIMTHRLFMRLRKAGLKPSLFIQWYENLAVEKAFTAGARKYFPGIKIVGAQMFLHLPNYLSLYPSQSEAEAGLVPDVLIETSAHQCDVARSFASNIRCRAGAALRYAYIFDRNSKEDVTNEPDAGTIAVLLPSFIPESVELLDMINNITCDTGVYKKVLIRVHPDDDPNGIIDAFGRQRWPPGFCLCGISLPELFRKASLIISASSSAMVEAAAHGVPVIYVGSKTMLYQNILRDVKMDIARECYSEAELKEAISYYLNADKGRRTAYREMGKKVRDMFFTPINSNTLAPFLNLDN